MQLIHKITDNTYVSISPDEIYVPKTWKGRYAMLYGTIAIFALVGLALYAIAQLFIFIMK